jgi:hypothetical protein
VAQLVEALRYKPEGRWFDSLCCHWKFSLTQPFFPHYDTEVDSTSNRNEYQDYLLRGKGGLCVGLTSLPPSCVECLVIWEPHPPGVLKACPGLWSDCLTSTITVLFLIVSVTTETTIILWNECFFFLLTACASCHQPSSHNFLQLVVTLILWPPRRCSSAINRP